MMAPAFATKAAVAALFALAVGGATAIDDEALYTCGYGDRLAVVFPS